MASSSQRRPWKPSTLLRGAATLFACAFLALVVVAGDASAQDQQTLDPVRPSLGEAPLFSLDSPIGAIEYRAGRGLHFGRTGLNIGGFTTLEFEREEGGPGELAIDGLNFLVLLQPIHWARAFAEIEIDNLLTWQTDQSRVESNPEAVIERLFGDLILDDPFTVRFGKFQTPVGRWNLVPAEPFTWSATEPVMVETAFDEHTTGPALLGSVYPASGTLSYWIYGQVLDPLHPSEDPDPLDRSVGARLQFDRSVGNWSVGASFLASELGPHWSYLGGLDAEWLIGPLELTSEVIVQRGNIEDRNLWGLYIQGVYEILPEWLPNVYLVGRYEHFDPSGAHNEANLWDLGITWIPKPYLRLKATYRLSDRETDDVARGVKVTFSVVF
jgi:hypothetical protein